MSIEERVALWRGVNMTPEGLGWGSLITHEKNLINPFRPQPKPILKLFYSCNLTISTYFNITLIFMTINPATWPRLSRMGSQLVRGTTQGIFFFFFEWSLWLNHLFAEMADKKVIIIIIKIHPLHRIFSWSVCSWRCFWFCHDECDNCTFISL